MFSDAYSVGLGRPASQSSLALILYLKLGFLSSERERIFI